MRNYQYCELTRGKFYIIVQFCVKQLAKINHRMNINETLQDEYYCKNYVY